MMMDLREIYRNPIKYRELKRRSELEVKLREENPGLKDLWDQYQTMLELLMTEHDCE